MEADRSNADASTSGSGWRRFWRDPDPVLADAGANGEHLIARVRVLVTLLLLTVPLTNLLVNPHVKENRIGLTVAVCASALAIITWLLVRRGRQHSSIAIATTVFDVTLVSAALISYCFTGQPLIAANSRVVFEAYFLAIFATCLRYDVRLCALSGALAIAQFIGVSLYASQSFDLGALATLDDRYGRFDWSTQISRAMLIGIAAFMSGVFVYRARDLRRLSAIDRMTGLFNRGHFDERLHAELNRAQRRRSPLSLVMLDVDRFKQFNDRYGHTAGDIGLKALADAVRQMTRRSDVVARYGGEEFVFLLPDTGAEAALEKLEQIRAAVELLAIPLPKAMGHGSLTVSAGIATYPADGHTADELLDEADARLFRAKAAGRNRVVGRAGTTAGTPRVSPMPGLERIG